MRKCEPKVVTRSLKLWSQEALKIYREDVTANQRIGRHGAKLIPKGATVLTHCNAGALATAGYGTALGVIRAAWEQGKNISVFVPETRPYLQGARLTAWETRARGDSRNPDHRQYDRPFHATGRD